MINSLNRINFFTKDGEFINMIKTTGSISLGYQPLKPDNYVGRSFIAEEGIAYATINIYNSKLEKTKQIYKIKRAGQQTGPIKLFSDRITFQTFEDKIFVQSPTEFKINVLDNNGNKLYAIHKDYEALKFTERNKKDLFKTIESTPQGRAQMAVIKARLKFPSHFPPIATLMIADDFLYAITWKYNKDNFECFVFSTKTGKEIKKIYLPFQRPSPLAAYPMSVRSGILYQLVENDNDEWELHTVKLN
jgi:hypothetical protein